MLDVPRVKTGSIKALFNRRLGHSSTQRNAGQPGEEKKMALSDALYESALEMQRYMTEPRDYPNHIKMRIWALIIEMDAIRHLPGLDTFPADTQPTEEQLEELQQRRKAQCGLSDGLAIGNNIPDTRFQPSSGYRYPTYAPSEDLFAYAFSIMKAARQRKLSEDQKTIPGVEL
jgi:hypothetical protein